MKEGNFIPKWKILELSGIVLRIENIAGYKVRADLIAVYFPWRPGFDHAMVYLGLERNFPPDHIGY